MNIALTWALLHQFCLLLLPNELHDGLLNFMQIESVTIRGSCSALPLVYKNYSPVSTRDNRQSLRMSVRILSNEERRQTLYESAELFDYHAVECVQYAILQLGDIFTVDLNLISSVSHSYSTDTLESAEVIGNCTILAECP